MASTQTVKSHSMAKWNCTINPSDSGTDLAVYANKYVPRLNYDSHNSNNDNFHRFSNLLTLCGKSQLISARRTAPGRRFRCPFWVINFNINNFMANILFTKHQPVRRASLHMKKLLYLEFVRRALTAAFARYTKSWQQEY